MTANIFGYTWDEIRAAQQGASLTRPVQHQPRKTATADDLALLHQYGLDGLQRRQFFGVIDRLQAGGHI